MAPFYGSQIHIALAFWPSGWVIAFDVSNLVASCCTSSEFRVLRMQPTVVCRHSEFRVGSSNSATAAVRLLVQTSEFSYCSSSSLWLIV